MKNDITVRESAKQNPAKQSSVKQSSVKQSSAKQNPAKQEFGKQEAMRQKTLAFMKEYHMTDPGGQILIALSGGADSVCLLYLLHSLKEELAVSLSAVHVNHGLRGEEADRDAVFSGELCRRLQIPFRLVCICAAQEAQEAGISVEEAGRQARYRIFAEEAKRLEGGGSPVKIATAHHGDDSAETILFHLLRGSGLKGLGGIPPVRGRVIRPLLWADRASILDYLSWSGLSCMEDSSNREDGYTRNKIRNRLLPMVTSEINSRAVLNILRAGAFIAGADRYLEKQAQTWLEENERWETGGREDVLLLPAAPLLTQDPLIGGYILRQAFVRLSCPLKDVTAVHIEKLQTLAGGQTGKRLNLPYGITAWKEYGLLCISRGGFSGRGCQNRGNAGEAAGLSLMAEQLIPIDKIPEEGLTVCCGSSQQLRIALILRKNQGEIPKNQCTKWFDYDKIKNMLCARYRRNGDYITLPSGGHKTLKKYFIDEKIPRQRRDQILLLTEGSHILWITGLRVSEYYKVTEDTKTILRVQLDGGK